MEHPIKMFSSWIFLHRHFLTILIMVRAAILRRNYLWLLPFYIFVATYFYYEKVHRTICTAIVSNLKALKIIFSESFATKPRSFEKLFCIYRFFTWLFNRSLGRSLLITCLSSDLCMLLFNVNFIMCKLIVDWKFCKKI